jgi:signal transduction histidine kinase
VAAGRRTVDVIPAWPVALDDPAPEVRLRRSRFALATVIARAKPGTFFYTWLALAYWPVASRHTADLIATSCAAVVLTALAFVRRAIYRRTDLHEVAPDRWRRITAVLAAIVLGTWDAFVGFEVWEHRLDTTAMLLIAVSLVLRASSTYIMAPDRYAHRVAMRWSRPPLLLALLLIDTPLGFITFGGMFLHWLYIEIQAKQLNEELWGRVIATESLARAHEQLKHEVAMREQAEAELRLAQKLESVGRLAAGIAHEINSPLQAILNSHELVAEGTERLFSLARARPPGDAELAAELDELAELVPESLQVAGDSLARVAAIVRSVRAFAQPNAGSGKSCVDLNQALLTTLTLARHEYSAIADVVTDLGELPLVECYGGELNQVFLNVIVNAAHAIAATGTRGAIRVASRADRDRVRIAISDTGCGVADGVRDRIFDPFFTTKAVGKGTGQGLAIAHAIVTKRHGGELTFDTRCGQGTTFHIVIPRAA